MRRNEEGNQFDVLNDEMKITSYSLAMKTTESEET